MALSHPAAVMERLEDIAVDMAHRQNELEEAAMEWFTAKRDKERRHAELFLAATGTVAERTAKATKETAHLGSFEEATYESLKAVMRALEARASIGQSLLRAQACGGGE